MDDAKLSDLAQKAAEELWVLEKANPGIDFGDFHKACEALFDALTADKPGVVRPLGGGPK